MEERRDDCEFSVSVCVTEIYNEILQDLLQEGGSKQLDVRLNKKGDPEIPGLTEMQVKDTPQVRGSTEAIRA